MRVSLLPLLIGTLVSAQTPPAKLSFEVVSIKKSTQNMLQLLQSGQDPIHIDDAQAMYRSITLSGLIQMAFSLPDDQITAPGRLQDDQFDITAKLPAGTTKSQVPEMLQSMLAERFGLKVHHEEKVRQVYLLTVGKGPLKMKPTAGGDTIGCNGGAGGHHTCQNITMDKFAEVLTRSARMSARVASGASWMLDHPVVNKTGLTGGYDFPLDYGRVFANGGRRSDPTAADAGYTDLPIADAVKGLGLQLEPSKAPYDILVIDHIERVPTGN